MTLDGLSGAESKPLVFRVEVLVGKVLLWPIMVYGYFRESLTGSSSLGLESLIIQIAGYLFLFSAYQKYKVAKT